MPSATATLTIPPTATAVRGSSTGRRRLIGAVVALGAACVLGVAAWLDPSPDGLGTHRQLNLPACGWIVAADLPCPTCGMTTAFAYAAHGNLPAAFAAQPMGAVLSVSAAVALVVGLYTAVTGSRVAVLLTALWGRHGAWVLAGCIVGAWLYKIAAYKGWFG